MTEPPKLDYETPPWSVNLRRPIFWAFAVCAAVRAATVGFVIYLFIYF